MSQKSFKRAIIELGSRLDKLGKSYRDSMDMDRMEEKELCFEIIKIKESHGKAIQEMEDTLSSVSLKSIGMAIDELGWRIDASGTCYGQSADIVQKEVRKIKLG